jgi:pyrroloquinoline quinone (PQQ) biosynthesis protein C
MLDQTLARRVERIAGQAELLLNQPNLSDAERSLLDIIRSSAVRLYHYLDDCRRIYRRCRTKRAT